MNSSDDEPEQANSSDDESTNLESDDDVPNGWDPHPHWNFLKQSYRNYDDVPDEFESDDDEPDELESDDDYPTSELESDVAGRLRLLPGALSAQQFAVVLHLLSRAHGV